jgi:hypothetical protein
MDILPPQKALPEMRLDVAMDGGLYLIQAWKWALHKQHKHRDDSPILIRRWIAPPATEALQLTILWTRTAPVECWPSLDRLLCWLWYVWLQQKTTKWMKGWTLQHIRRAEWDAKEEPWEHLHIGPRVISFPFDSPAGVWALRKRDVCLSKGRVLMRFSRRTAAAAFVLNVVRPWWRKWRRQPLLDHRSSRGCGKLWRQIMNTCVAHTTVLPTRPDPPRRFVGHIVHKWLPWNQRARRMVFLFHQGFTAQDVANAWRPVYVERYRKSGRTREWKHVEKDIYRFYARWRPAARKNTNYGAFRLSTEPAGPQSEFLPLGPA